MLKNVDMPLDWNACISFPFCLPSAIPVARICKHPVILSPSLRGRIRFRQVFVFGVFRVAFLASLCGNI